MYRLVKMMLRSTVLAVLFVVGAGFAAYWYQVGSRWVTTENAYVKAEKVAISADIDGRVARVLVDNNQFVNKGELLFEIEKEPFQIALDSADAELASIVQQIEGYRANYRMGLLEIAEAEERVRYASVLHDRHSKLLKEGTGTKAQLDEAEHSLAMAQAQVRLIRERNDKALLELKGKPGLPVEQHPLYLKAKAARDQAHRDLTRTEIYAPSGGYLSNVTLEPGEYVEAGDPVFSLVHAGEPWIEANLKESQLTHVLEGQNATVVVDAYPDVEFEAKVQSISPATGAEFALLPPQNATGNWVKVVQRIPVRLQVRAGDDAPALRAGMTVSVRIDTGQERDIFVLVNKVLAAVDR